MSALLLLLFFIFLQIRKCERGKRDETWQVGCDWVNGLLTFFFVPFPAGRYSRGAHYREGLSAAQGDRKPNDWWCHSRGNMPQTNPSSSWRALAVLKKTLWLQTEQCQILEADSSAENDFSALERCVIWVEKQRGGGLERGWIMISNRRQREAAQEGTKEGQTEESVWVRSDPPAAFFKAPRRDASILYYPSACLPSWRIFHLILVVTIENWTCRCVPIPFPLSRILFCSS